jgi:hypothetical protein
VSYSDRGLLDLPCSDGEVVAIVVCDTCGSVVAYSRRDEHSAWHAGAELAHLRKLLDLRPGEDLCLVDGGDEIGPCLLPARHVDEVGNGWHRGLGTTWS